MEDDGSSATADSKFAPQQKRSREARARIIDAAERLLRYQGVGAFSMLAVAQAANRPVGNIYRRFAGKEDLLRALKFLVSTRITAGIGDAVLGGTHDSLEAYVRCFALAVAKVFAYDEHLNRALYDLRLVEPDMIERGQKARHVLFAIFDEGLQQYLADLPEKNRAMASKVAFSLITNAAAMKVRDNDTVLESVSWDEVAAEFGQAVVLYLQSLR